MKIILTGASGYIGSQLVDLWLKDNRIEEIIAIDLKDPKFLFEESGPKIRFIKKNVADIDFEKEIPNPEEINAVVHAAYLIRTPYFKKDIEFQDRSNFVGAENIFRFALRNNISRLVHFSTVAVYGADPKNNFTRLFKEEDELREVHIKYGVDKKSIERNLEELVSKYHAETTVSALRVGSVSGPFSKYVVKKKGLLSFFRGFLPFIPVTSGYSARQFVHEDDVVSAVNLCAFGNLENKFNVFNIAPNGYLTFGDIAKFLGKKTLAIPRPIVAFLFFILWHLSFGKIPTPPNVINSYSFPILVDGTKIYSYGFQYKYSCLEAFASLKGKFSNLKPQKE
ncbi:MAG: NAD-dependent epimerase/dehydratase family protein [Patescibacteria group bacterium]